MYIRPLVTLTLAAQLAGCMTAPVCVAIDNPNEQVLAGRISAKEHIDGKVLIRSPKSVKVTDPGPSGDQIAKDVLVVLAIGAIGVAAGADPGMVGSQYASQMADPAFHPDFTQPGNPNADVGEPCDNQDQLLEDGATRYRVATDRGEFFVHSAFPGFQLEQCVKLFISDNQGSVQSRIASGSQCPQG